MSTLKDIKKAAQQCLDEKWHPMSKAKTVREIFAIYYNIGCPLCELLNNCNKCPMKTGRLCSRGFSIWNINADFKTQHPQIMVVVAELETIVKG